MGGWEGMGWTMGGWDGMGWSIEGWEGVDSAINGWEGIGTTLVGDWSMGVFSNGNLRTYFGRLPFIVHFFLFLAVGMSLLHLDDISITAQKKINKDEINPLL